MIFRVNYELKNGDVVSYQEGGTDDDNHCPDGCATLVFADVVPGMLDYTQMKMKVDVKKKELVFVNPVEIPKPISG